jgi:predicted RecA/RadA family phage recombinase
MPQATLRKGNPFSIDYTPSSAVEAGDVIVQGELVGVARLPIPANTKGTLDVSDGEFEVIGDAAIAIGKVVFWNDAANKVTENANSGANKRFGKLATPCSGDGAVCRAVLGQA